VEWQVYKRGQGRYVRTTTAVGAGVVMAVLCYYVYVLLERHVPKEFAYKVYAEYAVPAVLFVVLGAVAGYFMNKPAVVDFFIATESEMKKVSWSSRAALFGSTAVVIATVLLLALMIWLADTGIVLVLTRGLGLW
jgi:preprotein translocase SecE subunit